MFLTQNVGLCMDHRDPLVFLKCQLFSSKELHKRHYILQKRPIISRSLLIVAPPHSHPLAFLKCQLFGPKELYKRDYILQKKPIIPRSLLVVATPHSHPLAFLKCQHSCPFWLSMSLVIFWYMFLVNFWGGVATISRLLQITSLFCKRALLKRVHPAKETYDFKEPTNRSHPIYVSSRLLTLSIIDTVHISHLFDTARSCVCVCVCVSWMTVVIDHD